MVVSPTRIKRITAGVDPRLRELENLLGAQIQAFYKSKILPRADTMPVESLRKMYGAQIIVKIRAMVETAYREGTELVAREITRLNPDFILFTSGSDISQIQQKTNELNEQFWTTVNRLLIRHNEFVQEKQDAELVRKKQFAVDAAMLGVASLVIYKSFNTGVKTKAEVVNSPAVNVPITPPPGGTGGQGQIPGGFGLESTLTMRRLNADLLFLTAEDAKVCTPETNKWRPCSPLNRTVYDMDEPGLPSPPLHRFCRCQLVPLVGTESF